MTTASGLPFLVMAIVYEPDGHGAWVAGGGSVHRWSITRAEGAQMGEPSTTLRWEPNTQLWAEFNCESLPAIPSYGSQPSYGSVWIIGAPVWPFLLVPTLLVLGTQHLRRTIHVRHQNRERAKGRTPCPTCNYDATNLTTCPECGTTISPVTETQT